MPFIPGKKYFVLVQACNTAGLCSLASSNGLTMDNTPPLAGRVFAGHENIHQKYISHVSALSGSWQGFEDPETTIVQFEWCLGSEPFMCNITSYEGTQLADSFMKSDLHLPLSVPLHLTVRATNYVGLQSVSTSDAFSVDNTVPQIIEHPHFSSPNSYSRNNVSVQTDNSVIRLSWKFEDQESPIVKHILTLKTHHESNVSLERKEIGAETSQILTFHKDNRLRNGDVYSVSVTACNQAGLCDTSHSQDLLIDSTPPQLGGFKTPLTWENFQSANKTQTLVNLTWIGFSDAESAIAEYQLMISRYYDGFELSDGIEHVIANNVSEQSASILLSDQLTNGELVILSIRAKNGVGLITTFSKITVTVIALDHGGHSGYLQVQRHSCDVHYCTSDCTCAIVGRTCEVSQATKQCVNIQNQTNLYKYPEIKITTHLNYDNDRYYTPSTSCISAEWDLDQPGSLENITRFEWSMGFRGQNVGFRIFNLSTDRIWHSTGREQNITYCLPSGKSLQNKEEYVVYVRVWYSFTEYKQFESPPVLVDATAPSIPQRKIVKDSDETCKNDYDFMTRNSLITACWGGVFSDSQSGIDSYFIQIGSSPHGSDVMKPLDVQTNINYSISHNLLRSGTKYYVTVKAVNKAGLYAVAYSDGFVIDDEAPLAGVVFNTAEHVNQAAQSSLSSFGISWHGFQDHHSAIVNYQVAVYNTSDVPSKLLQVNVGFKNSIVLTNLPFVQGAHYQASVTAVDSAGHTSETVMSPPMLIDSTPPTGFECSHFSEISRNITWHASTTTNDPLPKRSLKTTIDVHRKEYFKICLTKPLQNEYLFSEMNIFFKVGDTFVPRKLLLTDNATRMEANHFFLAQQSGSLDIEIMTEKTDVLSEMDISMFSCNEIKTVEDAKALTVQQIMPSLLSVCARVLDQESDLLRIQIGVGTTHGGFQIQPLKPTFLHLHEVVEANVPHGTPIFVTVTAENSAELVSVFQSDSLIIDHTPPSISKISATLMYSFEGNANMTVTVDVTWKVHDKESGVKSCWCALGTKPLSGNTQPWILATQVTKCSLKMSNVYHGQEVYASVKCFNQIELHSSTSVGPRIVLLQPPSSQNGKVMFIMSNENPDTIPRLHAQFDTKRLQVAWFGLGDSYKTKTFLYQIKAGVKSLTGWLNTSHNYAELDVDLHDGQTYTAEVIAVDERQQKSDPITGSLVVDSRSPTLTGSAVYTQWQEDIVHLNWRSVFHHPRSGLVYNVAIGSRPGYTDLLHVADTSVTSISVDVSTSVTSLNIVVKATADNGEFVIYTANEYRK